MSAPTQGEYERATQACLAACAQWKAEHPDARLRFQPMLSTKQVAIIANLSTAIHEFGVAGNSATRKLLTAMDRATPGGGATVMMADLAIERVYGIPRALTEKKN